MEETEKEFMEKIEKGTGQNCKEAQNGINGRNWDWNIKELQRNLWKKLRMD